MLRSKTQDSKFIQTTLEKAFDTIKTKLDLNAQSKDTDRSAVDSLKDKLDKEINEADNKIQQEIANLRDTSLKSIEDRNKESFKKKEDLEKKRRERRERFESIKTFVSNLVWQINQPEKKQSKSMKALDNN